MRKKGSPSKSKLFVIIGITFIVITALASAFALLSQGSLRVGIDLRPEEAQALERVVAERGLLAKSQRLELVSVAEGKTDPSDCDIVILPPSSLARYPALKAVNLNSILDASQLAKAIPPSLSAAASYQGRTVILPILCSPYGLYYNRAALAAIDSRGPETYEALLAMAGPLKAKNIIPLAIAGRERGRIFDLYSLLDLGLAGREAHSAYLEGKTGLAPASLEAFYGLFRSGFAQRAAETYGERDATDLLLSGKAAFLFAPPSVHLYVPAERESEIGFLAFPRFAGKNSYDTVARVEGALLTRRGGWKAGAKALMRALASPEIQAAIVKAEAPSFISVPAHAEASFVNLEGRTAAITLLSASRVFDSGAAFLPPDRQAKLDEGFQLLSRAFYPSPDKELVAELDILFAR